MIKNNTFPERAIYMKINSPQILRSATTVEKYVPRRSKGPIRIAVPIPAVEDPRAGRVAVGVAVLVEVDELVQSAEVQRSV